MFLLVHWIFFWTIECFIAQCFIYISMASVMSSSLFFKNWPYLIASSTVASLTYTFLGQNLLKAVAYSPLIGWSSGLILSLYCDGCHAGSTVEQQLFSVDLSVVLIHQGLSLFQPIKAITGIGAIKPGDIFEGFVYSASLLVFMLLHSFSVFFSLFSFFFHSFSFFFLFLHLVTFHI